MNRFPSYSTLFFLTLFFLACKVKQNSDTNYANVTQKNTYLQDGKSEASEAMDEPADQEEEAEADPYANDNYLRYTDHSYKTNIKSAQLYIKGEPRSIPVLFLNDGKQLELHFDDLNKNYATYSYDFIHCNANWQPSGLVTQEYIEGFFNGYIEDYKYSFNTLFPYIHYKVEFPNEDIRFKKSGNYLIQVYANGDKEDLLLTRRFYVVDQRISIESQVKMATLARFRDYKQEVDFTLNHTNYTIQDPYTDLKVVVSQNRRWDNAISDLKPLFVRTPELVYNYERENIFNGNNEFRFFDAKNLRYQSLNVDGIQIIKGQTHLFVMPNEPRSYKRYSFQNDLNGQRLIKRDDSPQSDREADYVKAHFTLKRETKLEGGDIYVFGQLSDWNFMPEFKMEYVDVNKEYTATALIKQGYYNYAYVFLPDGKQIGDMSVIEGTHSATENEYYFFVYHRQRGEIYDRLVGFRNISTNTNQY